MKKPPPRCERPRSARHHRGPSRTRAWWQTRAATPAACRIGPTDSVPRSRSRCASARSRAAIGRCRSR